MTVKLKNGIWVMYLRKSRQDDPRESVEEVLSKHEAQLQSWAEYNLGHRIPEEHIIREVASAESISGREGMQRLLAEIESPDVVGVAVVDLPRLSRGALDDVHRVIVGFELSGTQIATPMQTYDLRDKMQRTYVQDELLRGRYYYEYVKDTLFAGRERSINRGNFLGRYAPYGYRKIREGKDCTLEIHEEEAAAVRLIFEWYTREDLTPGAIGRRLDSMGIKPQQREKWHKDTIRCMLRNAHYVGKVVYNRVKHTKVLEDGEVKVKRLMQEVDDMIIVEGKHPAIIDPETWEKAQEMVARNPRKKHEHALKNPLSGVLVCSVCGGAMFQHPYKHADDRYECRTRPRCLKSVKVSAIMDATITALEEAELPALQLKVQNGDGNARKIQQQLLAKLERQMEDYRAQEEKQYDLLETGVYTQDLFERRNAALREKIDECLAALYQTKATMPQAVDYAARVVELQAAIDILKDPTATPKEQNKVVRAIVDKIEYIGPVSDRQNKKRQNRTGVDPFELRVTLRL